MSKGFYFAVVFSRLIIEIPAMFYISYMFSISNESHSNATKVANRGQIFRLFHPFKS